MRGHHITQAKAGGWRGEKGEGGGECPEPGVPGLGPRPPDYYLTDSLL